MAPLALFYFGVLLNWAVGIETDAGRLRGGTQLVREALTLKEEDRPLYMAFRDHLGKLLDTGARKLLNTSATVSSLPAAAESFMRTARHWTLQSKTSEMSAAAPVPQIMRERDVSSIRTDYTGVTTVWIPSWPRSGSTTIFKMVLAAAREAGIEATSGEITDEEREAILEDRGRGGHKHAFVPKTPPSEPGCYVVMPSGCPQKEEILAGAWLRDNSTVSSLTRMACEDRRSHHNNVCGKHDAAMLFVPNASYNASKVRRHFAFFEPCHEPLGNKTKADVIVGGDDCKSVMTRLLQCDFTGMRYLWGWNRPHTDITGVTVLGSNPPEYSIKLASDSCVKSDLAVFKTVVDFGRNANDVVKMLDAHPHVRVLMPVRDPRAIYASWKQLPWEFEGISLLSKICTEMAMASHVWHPSLKRVVFEKLIEHPVSVMSDTFKFLELDFGEPQQRWIRQTFNANCTHVKGDSRFYTCRGDSEGSLARWQQVLTKEETEIFRQHPACREVSQIYGY